MSQGASRLLGRDPPQVIMMACRTLSVGRVSSILGAMLGRFACIFPVLCVLAGCAIHPLPDDVTGVTTAQIVQQIRCETRDAAIQALTSWLEDLGRDHPSPARAQQNPSFSARVNGGGSPAEALAVYAVDQLKSRQFQLIPAQ